MKKCLFIAGIVLGSLAVHAQESLDTVTVKAQRSEISLKESSRGVTLLSRKEIEEAPVQSLNELLEYALALDMRQRSTFDVQSDISIRGGTFDQTLVLIDGIKMSDPQTGHHTMNLPLTMEQIERIEILPGGASRVYGPGAFSGAINIITKKEGDDVLSLSLTGGENGLLGGNITQAFSGKNHYTTVSYSRMSSDGYVENTDFTNQNIFLTSRIDLGDYTLDITGGQNWKEFGAQSFYTRDFPDQYERTRTQFASARINSGNKFEKLQLSSSVYVRRHFDRFETFREDYYNYDNGYFVRDNGDTAQYFPGFYYPGHNYHRTDVYGAEMKGEYNWKRAGTSSLGLEWRQENILSNALGEELEGPVDIPGSRGAYSLGLTRDNLSLYAEHRYTRNRWSLSGGFMYNYNTDFTEELIDALSFLPAGQLFYGAELGYFLRDDLSLYGSANRAFRLPTFTDLYYNQDNSIGSSDLQPESSMNYELGARYYHPSFTLMANFFRRESQNLIDWVHSPGDTNQSGGRIHRARNITEVNMNGFELQWRIHARNVDFLSGWMERLTLNAQYTFTDSRDESYENSLYAIDYLQNKVSVQAMHRIWNNLYLSWQYSLQKRNGTYTDFETGEETDHPHFSLLDARLGWKENAWELYTEGSNLLDTDFYDGVGFVQAGRWLRAGIYVRIR